VDVYTVVGLAGVAFYVSSYALLQLGQLDGNGVLYSLANVVAATLVLISLTSDFNLASAVTQVIWIVVGLGGITFKVIHRMTAQDPSAEGGQVRTVRFALVPDQAPHDHETPWPIAS